MDLDIYTTEMSKSIWDKAFFMDKIPDAKCVIDFGCADGAMIRYLAPLFPDIYFIGYDINNDLIHMAQKTVPFYPNVRFYCKHPHNSLDTFIQFIKDKFNSEEICINFSSVLHEVYSSTGGLVTLQYFIDMIRPRYITIRDMYCDEPLPITMDQVMLFKSIFDKLPDPYCQEFIDKFGYIHNWKDMTHLLMKIQWINNGWEEEMKENYYSWTIDQFLTDIGNKYIPAFDCRYQLPYLSEKWKNEYGWYNPDIHTHAQFILRRDD